MKTKHTPGPWSYDRAPRDYDGAGSPAYSTITAENGEIVIAEVNDMIPSGLANAHLLVAAPDLLDALQMMLGRELMGGDQREGLGPDKPGTSPVAKACAAIAKATGGDAR